MGKASNSYFIGPVMIGLDLMEDGDPKRFAVMMEDIEKSFVFEWHPLLPRIAKLLTTDPALTKALATLFDEQDRLAVERMGISETPESEYQTMTTQTPYGFGHKSEAEAVRMLFTSRSIS